MPELELTIYSSFKNQLLTTSQIWISFLYAACPKISLKSLIEKYLNCKLMPGDEAKAPKQQESKFKTYLSRLGPYKETTYIDVSLIACKTSPNTTQSHSTRCRKPKTKPMPLAQLFSCGLNVFTSLRSVLAWLYVSIRTVMSSCNQCTQVKWVTVEKCAELIGLTKDAIDALRTKGKLRQNFHWKKWEGRVYINLQAYQDSIEQEFKA